MGKWMVPLWRTRTTLAWKCQGSGGHVYYTRRKPRVAKQNAAQAQNVPTTSFGTIFVSMLRDWQTLVKDADLPKQITPTSELWETDCKVAHGSGWHATCALHTPTDVTTRVLVEAGWPNDA